MALEYSQAPLSPNLPIHRFKNNILETVWNNPATIIVGETGSGKSTGGLMMLYEAGFADRGRIGITQPRKLAATSLAEYVAGQLGTQLGEEVGYQVRFDAVTSPRTKLKFMTDGILLQEAKGDPLFSKYDVLVFDEAHERGLNTDFGLGLARRALETRRDLRVVVMSATIDSEKFSKFFFDAPVIDVDGKMYPVEERYLDEGDEKRALEMFRKEDDGFWRRGQDEVGLIEALAAYKVNQIHTAQMNGDVLVFMPTTHLIRKTVGLLEKLGYPDLFPVSVYGDMSPQDQRKIYDRFPGRKVVVSTNIAETSITIDGVVHVVDSGLTNEMSFDPHRGISNLEVKEHSLAGIKQRLGRAGRTQSGIYWGLYTKEQLTSGRPDYSERDLETYNYKERPKFTTPDILKSDLADVALRLIGMGITDIEQFPFIDKPDQQNLDKALQTLEALGAIDSNRRITEIGIKMHELPVAPKMGRMIVEAEKYGCVDEICTVAASLSTKDIFVRPKDKEAEADAARSQLQHSGSDFLTLLEVVNEYEMITQYNNQRDARSWARENFLNYRTIEEIVSIRDQLFQMLAQKDVEITSAKYLTLREELLHNRSDSLDDYKRKEAALKEAADSIGISATAGLLENLAISRDRSYESKQGTVYIHPSSAAFYQTPRLIAYKEVVKTSKPWARGCQPIKLEWVKELAPHLVTEEETTYNSIYSGPSTTKTTYVNGMIYSQERVETDQETTRPSALETYILGRNRFDLADRLTQSPPAEPPKPDFIQLSVKAAELRVRLGAVQQGLFEMDKLGQYPVVELAINRLDTFMEGLDGEKLVDDLYGVTYAIARAEEKLRLVQEEREVERQRLENARIEAEKTQAEAGWKAYQENLAELKQQYGSVPEFEFGVFEFPIDEKSGEPRSFTKDGVTYRFDWNSDFIPEDGKKYWGFRNGQTVLGKSVFHNIVLLTEEQEMPEILKDSPAKK